MRKVIFIVVLVLLFVSCKKGKPGGPDPIDPVGTIILSSPLQNSVCITGNVISATKSEVELKWEKVANASNYVVTVKDLLTSTSSSFTTDQNQYITTLNRNTPYSWNVVAQGFTIPKTSKSETWKFYNAGNGVISYSPFPADNLMPGRDQVIVTVDGKTTLSWTGSDADNDILNYDVYLGTTPTPPLLKREITESRLEKVELTSKSTYYWKVITRDKNGNTSESNVVPFLVK